MSIQIKPNIYWVGAIDWGLRHFHGHTYYTKRGGTYNSYLIMDEIPTLVDAVLGDFSQEMIDRIKEITSLESIKQIIVNHVEPDHSGALPELLKLIPHAKLFGTAKCKEGLAKYYQSNWNFQVVKTGDSISTGQKTVKFLEASMIHWPDSMFSYIPQEKLLLPNDGFGQQWACNERFDDEVDQAILYEETVKYYASILWPWSTVIKQKLDELQNLSWEIDMIAPAHGLIWRQNPKRVMDWYHKWSSNESDKKVVIVYETMWNSTKQMAEAIGQGLQEVGIPYQIFDINQTDKTDVLTAMLDAKAYLFGSAAYDGDMLPNLAGFMHYLRGCHPQGRIAGSFGSFGWGGGATKALEQFITDMKVEMPIPSLTLQWRPTEQELEKCRQFGRDFGEKIKI